jgi:hypothetical protein
MVYNKVVNIVLHLFGPQVIVSHIVVRSSIFTINLVIAFIQ